jgi:hypothetical protein
MELWDKAKKAAKALYTERYGAPNTREFPTEIYGELQLEEQGTGGVYNNVNNTIAYPHQKEYYNTPYAPGAPIRQHEWKHWQQFSGGKVTRDDRRELNSKFSYEQNPNEIEARKVKSDYQKESGFTDYQRNRDDFINKESDHVPYYYNEAGALVMDTGSARITSEVKKLNRKVAYPL